MADEVRVEMVRKGSRMELRLGELLMADVDPGIPAQQLARYIEMQVRAGYEPKAIQAMLRGESKATTGSTPVRRKAPPSKAPKSAPKQGPDLSKLLSGTVGDVKEALASGELDDHLDAVEAAEKAGKARKGVLKAVAARGEA